MNQNTLAEGTLCALDDLSEEELQAMEDAAALKKQEDFERREKLAGLITKHRDGAIVFRVASGIERQWAEDQAYYEGEEDTAQSSWYKGLTNSSPLIAKPKAKYKSKVFLNITRVYVETAASKVIEVLSPTDMRAWSIEPSAIPNMPEKPSPLVQSLQAMQAEQQPQPVRQQIGPDGQPVQAPAPVAPPIDPVEEMMKAAQRAALGAQTWIDNSLSRCDFQGQIRVVIDDASRLGTGVMRGPIPVNHRSMKIDHDQQTGEQKVSILEAVGPQSKAISCWDAYPDPACGDNIHNGQFFIEHDMMVEKQVNDLKDQPGYLAEQIDKVLAEGPKANNSATFATPPHQATDPKAQRFHVWYYYGFMLRDDVLAMNCVCNEEDELEGIGYPVIVTVINDTPVKVHLNPMNDGRFPYDFMVWQKVAGSPFGIGIARQIRTCQAILNNHVRAMMENAGLTSGPQIILSRGSIQPADNSWEITPRKIWLIKPDADIQDVQKVMNAFNIPSQQAELLAAIDFALKMAENVTGLPVLLQGQTGPNGVPETLGGMVILVANASSLIRRIARIFDDSLTKPHITAYYNFMMLYADDPSIKGDFRIIAHGATELVARDQRNTFITQAAPQMSANPSFGIDPTRLFKQIAKINGMPDAETIMFSPEEMKLVNQSQMDAANNDPRVMAAGIQVQGKVKVAEIESDTHKERIAKDRDRDTIYVNAETMRTQVTGEIKMAELQMRERLAMLEYANKNNISLQKLKADLAISLSRNDLARELASMPTVQRVEDAAIAGATNLKPTSNETQDALSSGEAPPVMPANVAPQGEPPGAAPLGMGAEL